MNLRQYQSVKDRRTALEEARGVSFRHIGSYSVDEQIASTRHCENMIGVAQIPLGVAGPLLIQGESYYLPLATTEGALVASVNRGCKAITESGGAVVEVKRVGATRGPAFRVRSLEEGKRLEAFFSERFSTLQDIAASTSRHLSLVSYEYLGAGRYRYVRFVFDTQDAMGLNMVTIATDALCSYINEQLGISCVAVSGNVCVDKKPAWINAISQRGFAVRAEATIQSTILASILKVSAEAVYETWLAKCMVGSALVGSMGYNAQYANIVAAMFIATGQDPAHVVEGSNGITTTEVDTNNTTESDLYISVYLPSLLVGTVGGGTSLPTQSEALSLLGVLGGNDGNNAKKLAGIIGGAILAGELSLLASLAQGTLAQAHERLARGKKV
ncbi:MAG: hydroxymethylglutaryl-CoA reductase [candidate division KSB1 bacterium]|nr:hydroxymethylglutaryl-CoA reductase [candidate division KSB1 bacterium]